MGGRADSAVQRRRREAVLPTFQSRRFTRILDAPRPDLVACQQCVGQLVSSIESRLGHTLAEESSRCTICDAQGPVRGVSIAWGRFLLRGMVCAKCQAEGVPRDGSHPEEADVDVPASLTTLGIPAIRIDSAHLSQTEVRGDFDELGWQMLARAGRLCQLLVDRAGRRPERNPQSG